MRRIAVGNGRVMQVTALDQRQILLLPEAAGQSTLHLWGRNGIERSHMRLVREADVRYVGQSMEVRVPAPAGEIGPGFQSALIGAFHQTHKRTFGYNYAGQQKVELVNFCVSGFGMIDRPRIPEIKTTGTPQQTSRPVYFDGKFRDTPVFARASLPAGFRLEGPAIVEEFGSTTVTFPGQHLAVDPHDILIIKAAGKAAEERS